MAVPTHFKFTFRGDFKDSPEHWSFGLKFSRDNPAEPDAGVDDIDDAAVTTALTTFFNSGVGQVPNNALATDWRAYVMDTTNHMQGNPLVVDLTGQNIDGSGGMAYPPQICAVITTVGADRGPARFGRFYLPTRAPIAADSRMSSTDATNLVEAASTFMKDVSNAIDMELATSSEGLNISTLAGGTKQTIDHLECGRVLDTLRNRRKSLDEERVSTSHIDW